MVLVIAERGEAEVGNPCEFKVNLVCTAVCTCPGLHGEILGGKKESQASKQTNLAK